MRIDELFNNPFPYELNYIGPIGIKKEDNWKGSFISNAYHYDVHFVGDNGKYSLSFNIDTKKGKGKHIKWFNSQEIITSGNVYEVFSTVIEILKEFIKNVNPRIITFYANEPSRQKLYSKMIKLVNKNIPGYEGIEISNGDYEIRKIDNDS